MSKHTIKISNPVDQTELSYAVEELVIEAREQGLETHEISTVLERTQRAVESDDQDL
jgi:DNA-binding transcriptional regulator YhcF (GntR family)